MTHSLPSSILDFGFTSDHVPRSIHVSGLSGFTWNLLKRCYSKQENTHGYANNPLDCSENVTTYVKRKRQQFQYIERLLKTHQFGLFQEIDFMFADEAETQPETPAWVPITMRTLAREFVSMLLDHGWTMKYQHCELAVIYNMSYLTYIPETHRMDWPVKKKNDIRKLISLWDFEWQCEPIRLEKAVSHGRFNDCNHITSRIVTLGVCWADFNTDYFPIIPEFMKKLQASGNLCIFGGDMNHPPNYNMANMMVLGDYCTNFFTNYEQFIVGYDKVFIDDEREALLDRGIKKNYDGFFVVPSKDFNDRCVFIRGEHCWDTIDGRLQLKPTEKKESCYYISDSLIPVLVTADNLI
jgi:hypothetical protein